MDVNFKIIEKKWQDKWEKAKIFEVNEKSKKPKYYVLEMFPYPSGSGLHMGHAWNYVIGDILARLKIMQGFNVLHPMGYDALGLPAENAAIQAKQHPANYAKRAIKNYIKQQKGLGLTYDWSRMISSTFPEYYKWDQWIFLQMLKKGLAYQKKSSVNWCPKCDTVLANEQVHNGKCWRHEDTNVEVKHLKQWFLKTTAYADELYNGIDKLKDWPERTKLMQKHWIGKSHGTEINFEINEKKFPIFTTRSDTIFGVTFMVISAQHEKLFDLVTAKQKKEVEKFLKKAELKNLEKEGVFTGSYAINPITKEKIPIYAGNFVLPDYGSGMVMAVPAHDQRDFEFAKKYGIKIKQVIVPKGMTSKEASVNIKKRAYIEKGKLISSAQFNGLDSEKAKQEITKFLIKQKVARKKTQFKLRDWGISRQRYWGTPIPIIHCEKCGAVPVPEEDLPVKLPKEVQFGKGNPLETNEKWLNVECPKCKGKGRREAETMDTFVNSSWYFLRYCDPSNDKNIFDKKKVDYWCPVDSYIGGAEHACMHLIYSRFYIKFLADLKLLKFREPTKRLFHQGMLHAEGGEKMSKSKGNIVLPETVSDEYGIDTARFFLCSLASPNKDIDWSKEGIIGSLRFINQILEYFERIKLKKSNSKIEEKLNITIKNVTNYFENFKYRKATIELRELFNLIYKENESNKNVLERFLQLLNPICPHITEELWNKLGNKQFLSTSKWPKVEKSKLKIKKKKVDLNKKYADYVGEIIKKLEGRGKKIKKVYLYAVPFEIDKINSKKIGKNLNQAIKIYSVKDLRKFDPENKSKKAKPGMPSVYIE